MLGMLVMGQPFGVVMAGIGVIANAGVIVNNNIVLIDTYDRLRREGVAAYDAILETCRERARPVVLTAVTAILGVLPIAFGVNIEFLTREITVGAPATQWWINLSTAIVFGLGFATVLTLIVTPAMLMAIENMREWRIRWLARLRALVRPRRHLIERCAIVTGEFDLDFRRGYPCRRTIRERGSHAERQAGQQRQGEACRQTSARAHAMRAAAAACARWRTPSAVATSQPLRRHAACRRGRAPRAGTCGGARSRWPRSKRAPTSIR